MSKMSKKSKLNPTEQVFLPPPGCMRTTAPHEEVRHRGSGIMMKLEFKIGSQVSKFGAKAVEVAIRRAAASTFRLSCGVDMDPKTKMYSKTTLVQLVERASELPLNFRFFDAGPSIDSFNSLVENVKNRELNTPYAYFSHETGKPLLLWRVSAIYGEASAEHSAKLTLVFGCNHVLGDGLSLGVVARNFAVEFDWVLELVKCDPPQSLLKNSRVWDKAVSGVDPTFDQIPMTNISFFGSLSMMYLSWYVLWRGGREIIARRGKYQRPLRTDPPPAQEPLKEPLVSIGYFAKPLDKLTISSRFDLSEEQTSRLIQNCRDHKTTVSGPLLASAALAYYQSLPEAQQKKCRSLSWLCTVSNRGYLRAEDQLQCGNFMNVAIINDERLNFPKPEEKNYSKKLWNLAVQLINTTKVQYCLTSKAMGVFFALSQHCLLHGKSQCRERMENLTSTNRMLSSLRTLAM